MPHRIEPSHSQYAFEDFAIRQVALLLNKANDAAKYANRSLVSPVIYMFTHAEVSHQSYRNIWDPDVESDGFRGERSITVLSVCASLTNTVVTQVSCRNDSQMELLRWWTL